MPQANQDFVALLIPPNYDILKASFQVEKRLRWDDSCEDPFYQINCQF